MGKFTEEIQKEIERLQEALDEKLDEYDRADANGAAIQGRIIREIEVINHKIDGLSDFKDRLEGKK